MQTIRDSKVSIQPGWYILVSVMLLILPVKLVISWLLAAAFHEAAHLACIKIFGVRVQGISVGFGGTVIQTDTMDMRTEIISAISGPCSGLLLFFLRRRFPLLSLCGMIQSLFNLLPVYPLDGGRVFFCLLSCFSCRDTLRLFIEWITFAGLLIFGIFLWIGGFGPIPVLCVIMLLIKNGKIKNPCKEAKQIVQYINNKGKT